MVYSIQDIFLGWLANPSLMSYVSGCTIFPWTALHYQGFTKTRKETQSSDTNTCFWRFACSTDQQLPNRSRKKVKPCWKVEMGDFAKMFLSGPICRNLNNFRWKYLGEHVWSISLSSYFWHKLKHDIYTTKQAHKLQATLEGCNPKLWITHWLTDWRG